ncbi:hypothetical protein [Rhizosaccharibacter radicis]|uniref:DUF551 domain-containing protein n=1 Tax=Rhizosaccharibacter radicis TaxID=2782605 RepID=A0ABT1VXB6_9PROT|nr:hypothetical protein [Acetobacteraceae bacterium KSS12]
MADTTPPPTDEAPRDWLIRRHGAWFRPDGRGYCTALAGAGLYTENEARRYGDGGIEGLTIHHVSEPGIQQNLNRALEECSRIQAGCARILGALATTQAEAVRPVGRIVRHKKCGTLYEVIGQAGLQTEQPLSDEAPLIVYRGLKDGDLWARSPDEFEDGRFEDVQPGNSSASLTGSVAALAKKIVADLMLFPFYPQPGDTQERHDAALEVTFARHVEKLLHEATHPGDGAADARRDVWQPIETAPKDGRELLLAFGNTFDAPPPLVAAWSRKGQVWLLVGAEVEIMAKPVAWMPLPAPPATVGEQEGGAHG